MFRVLGFAFKALGFKVRVFIVGLVGFAVHRSKTRNPKLTLRSLRLKRS